MVINDDYVDEGKEGNGQGSSKTYCVSASSIQGGANVCYSEIELNVVFVPWAAFIGIKPEI